MREVELLALLLHELSGPISAVYYDLERTRASVRRLIRRRRVFRIACAELSGDRQTLPPFRRRTITKALASLDLRGRAIVTEVDPSLAVRAASGAFVSVLQNLISNAHYHGRGARVVVRAYPLSPGATPWPRSSSVTLPGPAVIVEVADTGPGVPAALLPQLFEFGVHAGTDDASSGIGLWLSRLIVRAHGGELWLAESAQGARFLSVWPMALARKPPEPPAQQPPLGSQPPGDGWPADPKEFAKAVRTARDAAYLTRKDFAELGQVADSTLRNLETGRHRYTASTRRKVVEHFARLGIAPPTSPQS